MNLKIVKVITNPLIGRSIEKYEMKEDKDVGIPEVIITLISHFI